MTLVARLAQAFMITPAGPAEQVVVPENLAAHHILPPHPFLSEPGGQSSTGGPIIRWPGRALGPMRRLLGAV